MAMRALWRKIRKPRSSGSVPSDGRVCDALFSCQSTEEAAGFALATRGALEAEGAHGMFMVDMDKAREQAAQFVAGFNEILERLDR